MGGEDCVRELERRLGRDRVASSGPLLRLYSREPSGLEGRALAVVWPEREEHVSTVLRTCYKHGTPIYAQGSATSLSGNAVPEEGVVVSFERMNRIREISVVDSLAVVEPGVRIDDLNTALQEKGYMFPVDPASSAVATVGGAISNGAGGLRGAKYGTMRDWVLGLRLGLADERGTIIEVGCRTVKCRQGYDLTRLIVGSEGTLGLVTLAYLRITPVPEDSVYALAFYPGLDRLMEAFIEIKESGLNPFMLEFMDAETVRLASRNLSLPYTAEGDMLLVGVETYREASPRVLSTLEEILRRHGPKTLVTARGWREAVEEKRLLAVRKNLFAGQASMIMERLQGRGRPRVLIEDIVVPPSRVPEAVRRIRELGERYGLTVLIGGHIGDGNLHPAVGFDASDPEAARRVEEWFRRVMEVAVDLGGSVSAEHGIGTLKAWGLRMELERKGSLRALDLMRSIKRAFDPKGILNPGKVLPE